jgi:dihydrofolate reductase
MKKPLISMIVAMTHQGGVIGNKGVMPWGVKDLPRDMARFKKLTMGNPVAMGPRTYDSIGQPLGDRLNIIVTKNRGYRAPKGVLVAHDPNQAIQLAAIRNYVEFFVIGGAMLYASFLPFAERLFVTYVQSDCEGDTTFPYWDKGLWNEVWIEKKWRKGVKDRFFTRFAEYERKYQPLVLKKSETISTFCRS